MTSFEPTSTIAPGQAKYSSGVIMMHFGRFMLVWVLPFPWDIKVFLLGGRRWKV